MLVIEGIDMRRQLRIIQHKDKIITRLMAEFLDFCELAAKAINGKECLSLPENLKKFLKRYELEKNTVQQ